MQTVKNNS